MTELTVPNRIESLAEIDVALGRFFAEHRLDSGGREEIRLVLEELLANLIEHAYPDDAEHPIRIRLEYVRDELEIAVEDDGVPFDPLQQSPAPLAERLEAQPIGGFGLSIVRGLVDRLDYERVGRRNRVRLWKRIRSED